MKKALVYFIGLIGDSINAIPAIRVIQKISGIGCKIDLLCEQHPHIKNTAKDVFEGLETFDHIYEYPVGRSLHALRYQMRIGWQIRKNQYDAVFYLTPSQRRPISIIRDRIVFSLIGAQRLIGFNQAASLRSTGMEDRHEAKRYISRIVHDVPIDNLDDAFQEPILQVPVNVQAAVAKWLFKRKIHSDHLFVTLGIGTKQPANQWPLERFLKLGRLIHDNMGVDICIIGGENERRFAEQLVKNWGFGFTSAGELSILETAALLTHSKMHIGLDTGPTHLAAAVGCSSVGIYGGRELPGRWTPLGKLCKVIRASVPCEGCGHRVCPIREHPCMNLISVNEVWEAVKTKWVTRC